MRVWRGGLLFLVIAGGIVVAGATGASASTLEYGFCTKVAKGAGSYGTGTCTALGGYDNRVWSLLAPPESVPLALEKAPETEVVTFNFGRGAIYCAAQTRTEGVYTGEGEMRGVVFELTSCSGIFSEQPAAPCSSPGAPEGTVVTASLYGITGVIKAGAKPTEDKLGVALTPESGETFVEATCGPTSALDTGSVILPVTKNKMLTKQKIFMPHLGHAKLPERFEGGPKHVLSSYMNGTFTESGAAFGGKEILSTARALELRDCKPGC
jgi:hypothetical protein